MNTPPALLKDQLKPAFNLSVATSLLAAGASLAGLIFQNSLYPTDDIRNTFVANDVINLLLGLPVLLGSMWLARDGSLAGLLLWPGALLYILYNYLAYAIGVPLGGISFVYLALVLLSAYGMIDLLRVIDKNAVGPRLAGAVPVKLAGWILVGLGLLFILRALGMIAQASLDAIMLPMTEVGVLVADMALSAMWIAGGVLLLLRKPLGYASGLGLLFSGSMLFLGLILFLLLRPALTEAPFALTDVIVVLLMGMVCFIPFFVYLRGVLATGNKEIFEWNKKSW